MISETPIVTRSGDVCITVSAGVTEVDSSRSIDSMLASADAALYRAKAGGRNRAVFTWKDQELK